MGATVGDVRTTGVRTQLPAQRSFCPFPASAAAAAAANVSAAAASTWLEVQQSWQEKKRVFFLRVVNGQSAQQPSRE